MKQQIRKSLVLYPMNQKFHTVYDPTVKLFSKKYDLKYFPSKISKFYKIKSNPLLRKYYYLFIKRINKLKTIINSKEELNLDPKKNLLFCFNKIPPKGFDFILDLEIVTGLSNYDYNQLNKEEISKRLYSSECKAIICWNKASYTSLTNTIDCSKFKDKITIISFAKEISRIEKLPKKTFNFLFVSSINNPHDFEGKGGLIALEAYARLTKKFKGLRFFVRSNVAKDIVKRYKNIPGLIFLRKYLSEKKMEDLFLRTDVLLEPVPGINLMLECMNFGIPAVSFDFWCIREMIFSGKSGFLINSSKLFGNLKKIDKYLKDLKENCAKLSSRKEYHALEVELANKAEELMKDKSLLEKMSKYQRTLLESKGMYSIEKRNKKLTGIIDFYLQ